MPNPETEDPELDFTNFMEKQKAQLAATAPSTEPQAVEEKPATSPALIRGIVFFAVLLIMLGVLIVLYMNRPEGGKLTAPEGYRIIESKDAPPRLQKNQ